MKKVFALTIALLLLFLVGRRVESSTFASPILSYRSYLPIVSSTHPQKKCVAKGTGWGVPEEARAVGANCTYNYGPAASAGDFEVLGMVTYSPTQNFAGGNGPFWLGYNEPNLWTGVSITDSAAIVAERWPALVSTNYPKLPISPAVSQQNINWLNLFREAHISRWGRPPELYALAVHCYGKQGIDCREVVSRAIAYADAWGTVGGVWVTEFAYSSSWTSDWAERATQFVHWMDSNPRVGRYYWWALTYPSSDPSMPWCYGWSTQLFDYETKTITERGRLYASLP